MSQNTTDQDFDQGLEALFAEARDDDAAPLGAMFRDRLVADAMAARPGSAVQSISLRARLGALLWGVGGAPGLAGVLTAGVAGVWIGFGGTAATMVDQIVQSAASASPTVSTWVGDSVPFDDGSDILYILGGMQE